MNCKNEQQTVVVTIVCLTYNHEAFIKQCLDGFVSQKTNFQFEALIHDDASTDGTPQIIAEYATRYPDIIKPILETENQYAKGNNALLHVINQYVRGKYIALCEGDDYWTSSDKLQRQVDFLEAHPDYGMCFHNVALYNEAHNKITGYCERYKCDADVPAEDIIMNSGSFCPTNSLCFRRSLYDAAPAMVFNQYVGDYPLQMYLGISAKVRYMTENMGVYRINTPHSWSITTYGTREFERFKPIIDKEMKIYHDFTSYYPQYVSVFARKELRFRAYCYMTYNQCSLTRKVWFKQPWKDRDKSKRMLMCLLGLSKLYSVLKDVK